MSDLYQQVQDIDERVNELEITPLNTDINYDTMTNLTDFMQGNFWYFGKVTLASNNTTISLPGVSTISTPLWSIVGGSTFTFSVTTSADSLNIVASGIGTSNDTISYLVFI